MPTQMISAPTVEPLTLAELKAHLDIDTSLEDTLLTTLIVVARTAVERLTGRLLLTQTWKVTLDRVPEAGLIRLPLTPVQTVSAVRVRDSAGSASVWPASGYVLDLVGEPARLLFPNARPIPGQKINGLEIELVAGYGATSAALPPALVQAVRLLAAHWYATRGGDSVTAAIPEDVMALAGTYRRLRIAS